MNLNRLCNIMHIVRCVCSKLTSFYLEVEYRSQIKVHTDERTQAHGAQCSQVVTHPRTNRGRSCLTSVIVPLS